MNATKPYIKVVVGVILNEQTGEILLGQRPKGKPWEDWWEFPGGKIEDGESQKQALVRELKEELGIDVHACTPWVTFTYEYPKTIVNLAFWRVTGWEGTPRSLEEQQLAWTTPADAGKLGELLPASLPPLRWLALPEHYAISNIQTPENGQVWLAGLQQQLDNGLRLVQLREPGWPDGPAAANLKAIFERAIECCHAAGARVLVNSVHPKAWWKLADGVQLRAQDALLAEARPLPEEKYLVGVSAHNTADALYAQVLGADFVLLGHVLETPSHPDQPPLGWDGFASIAGEAGLPVYAIGGQSAATLNVAREHGAHGIAAIRGLAG